MKTTTLYKLAFRCLWIGMLFSHPVIAQENSTQTNDKISVETNKRIDDYLKLLKLGYSEREIFEDLGNVNFLTKNYETAAFWYQKLLDVSEENQISAGQRERYLFARQKTGMQDAMASVEEKDWTTAIREDYRIKNQTEDRFLRTAAVAYHEPRYGTRTKADSGDAGLVQQLQAEYPANTQETQNLPYKNAYHPPMAITNQGKTAYFSKPIYKKPKYGIFSKKQQYHKIYKAENVNGSWTNIEEVAVCPKYASALHPSVSDDGKRLFFASDMPGSFGKYDIYVAEIYPDGTHGRAKNLGTKVNTDQNDLYPNLVNGTLLFFASEGHHGKGGLDIYATQVARNEVGLAVNLGSPINSTKDDFALGLMADKGFGYVMSNRGGAAEATQQLVFSYSGGKRNALVGKKEFDLLGIISESNSRITNTLFEDY